MDTPGAAATSMDGTVEFWLKERAAFPGLDIEYFPPTSGLFPEKHCESIVRRLAEVEYTELVIGDASTIDESLDVPKSNVAYAWFASKGDWLLSLDKNQQNALVPIAPTDWIRDMGWCIAERTPSFKTCGMGMTGGGNAALVTWIGHPRVCPPPRRGVDCPKWLSSHITTTTYMYLGPERIVELTPGADNISRKFFDGAKVSGVPLSAGLRISLHTGSVFILRGDEAHMHWDLGLTVATDTSAPSRWGEESYFIVFQTIAPLRVHNEVIARPPKRTRYGITMQRRLIPVHEREARIPIFLEEDDDDDDDANAEEKEVERERKKNSTGTRKPPVKRKPKK